MKVGINVYIDIQDLSASLAMCSQDEILQVIKNTDLYVADYEFTETLVLDLTKSLARDMDSNDRNEFINKIKNIVGDV